MISPQEHEYAARTVGEPADVDDRDPGVSNGLDESDDRDIIVVAGVVDAEPADADDLDAEPADADDLDAEPMTSRDEQILAAATAGETTDSPVSPTSPDLGEQWHDIQARFVDDPGDAVRRAAEAADTAVSDLVTRLHAQRYAMVPGTEKDSQDTEQLRAALRAYRSFCQGVEDIGDRLTEVNSPT